MATFQDPRHEKREKAKKDEQSVKTDRKGKEAEEATPKTVITDWAAI